jgi:predicted nicotinamide N-methyase
LVELAGPARPPVLDTFAGKVTVEWDTASALTPLGQMPFFIEFLKAGGVFDAWVDDCPLTYTSPNAPNVRDVLGTVTLSVLTGHNRYGRRCDI